MSTWGQVCESQDKIRTHLEDCALLSYSIKKQQQQQLLRSSWGWAWQRKQMDHTSGFNFQMWFPHADEWLAQFMILKQVNFEKSNSVLWCMRHHKKLWEPLVCDILYNGTVWCSVSIGKNSQSLTVCVSLGSCWPGCSPFTHGLPSSIHYSKQ